jgi:hypothetical protein
VFLSAGHYDLLVMTGGIESTRTYLYGEGLNTEAGYGQRGVPGGYEFADGTYRRASLIRLAQPLRYKQHGSIVYR